MRLRNAFIAALLSTTAALPAHASKDAATEAESSEASPQSFAQESNLLVQHGHVLISPIAQYRPAERLMFGINAFNKLAIAQLASSAIPPSGPANAQVMNGRTVTVSQQYSF